MSGRRSRGREYDNDDVRVRPSRGSRPRTKTRPAHERAVEGFVIAVDRGRYTCLVEITHNAAPADAQPPAAAVEGAASNHSPASGGPAPSDPVSDAPAPSDPVSGAPAPPDPVTGGPAPSDPVSGAPAPGREVVAMKARELGRQGVVVGDRVGLVGDVSGATDSLARVVRVHERRNVLRRTADDVDQVERIVVANADQLAIVCAVADPQPRPRLVDRCLVAAFDAGLDPLLVLTKTDLGPPDDLLAMYRPLGVPALALSRGGDLTPLREYLAERITVLVGHSGVGKSTLVNALVPGTLRSTGHVNAVTGRGRHTSTSVVALPLPSGGWVIDTPGLRSFGLAHVDPDRLLAAFPDLLAVTDEPSSGCPRGCAHSAAEPECALDDAAAAGTVDPVRVDSYRRLMASRESTQVDDQ